LVGALGDDFVTRCVASTSPEEHGCVLAATTLAAMSACTQGEVSP
jgi:hypothetical protein